MQIYYRNGVVGRTIRKYRLRMKFSLLAAGIALSSLCATATATSAEAATYYVSKNGNNQDGKTWATAWNELNKIKWSSVTPGDTIVLDGGNGNSSLTYRTGLVIPVPNVIVTRTKATGHNGLVIIDGAATTPKGIAILANGVRVEGLGWRGISIRGCDVGLSTSGGASSYALVRNVECQGNKIGADLAGYNSRFDQLIARDNTDRNLSTRACGPYEQVSLTSSWIYNSKAPAPNTMPPRGIETAKGLLSTLTINRCVVGPGLGTGVEVNDYVVVLNSLLINAADFNLGIFYAPALDPLNPPVRLTAKNVTSFMTNLSSAGNHSHYCVAAEYGSVKTLIEKSIFYGGEVYLPPSGRYATETTQFRVTGNTTALSDTMVDPKFKSDVSSVPNNASFTTLNQLDFSLQPGSPAQGRGSSLSSSKTLVGQ